MMFRKLASCRACPDRRYAWHLQALVMGTACILICAGCMSPVTNMVRYAMADGETYLFPASAPGTGTLQGQVLHGDEPVPRAVVLVAEPEGTPHVTRTDAAGSFVLSGIPPGSYVPIAVAHGFDDDILRNAIGMPRAVYLADGDTIRIPPIQMDRAVLESLAGDVVQTYELTQVQTYEAEAPYPPDAAALVQHWSFRRNDTVNDTLYVYLPRNPDDTAQAYPLLLAIYPGHSLTWEAVSVGFASQGYAVVAMSPLVAYGRDIIEHGADARLALHFAVHGWLDDRIDGRHPLAMSGSYGSAVLNRLIRTTDEEIAAVVILGGISNAFTGAAAFYAGHLDWPVHLGYILASLGTANVRPSGFMQFAPVYTADAMPPAFLLHTLHDTMVPIEQSYEYAAALEETGVPVQTHYFADQSHYLQVGEDTTDTTQELFALVLDYLWHAHQAAGHTP